MQLQEGITIVKITIETYRNDTTRSVDVNTKPVLFYRGRKQLRIFIYEMLLYEAQDISTPLAVPCFMDQFSNSSYKNSMIRRSIFDGIHDSNSIFSSSVKDQWNFFKHMARDSPK